MKADNGAKYAQAWQQLMSLGLAAVVAASAVAALPPEALRGEVPSSDGVRIAYDIYGDHGPAVVLVHGLSCNRGFWSSQVGEFAPDHRVVTIDLAGHGDSGRGRSAWTMKAYGGDVAAVVTHLRLDRVVLVGHSMGGPAILEAARELRGRVAGIVLVDTYKQIDKPRTPAQVDAAVAPYRANYPEAMRSRVHTMFAPGANPAMVDAVADQMASAPPAIALPSMHATLSYEAQAAESLRALGLAAYAVNAGTPPTDVAALERNGVKVLIIPGSGHFPMMEKPADFNRALRSALDDLSRSK